MGQKEMDINRAQNRITLTLEGPKIPGTQFVTGINALFKLINVVSDDVMDTRRAVDWVVSVEPGSVVVHFDPEPGTALIDDVPKAIKFISDGLAHLEDGREDRPSYFNDDALKSAKSLANLVKVGRDELSRVRVDFSERRQTLSKRAVATVDAMFQVHRSTFGSVEGYLQTITSRGKYQFRIYDRLTDHPVTCFFPNELKQEVLKAFDKRVQAYGMVNYRKEGKPSSINVEDFKVFASSDELPSFSDIIGIYKNL